MLYSAAIIGEVSAFFRAGRRPPLVVDPVMIATSGARLLKPSAVRMLLDVLCPVAALVTPNIPEAEVMLNCRLSTVEELREAAREIFRRFGCAALVKGGHLRGGREAVDFFYDGRNELLLSAPYVTGVSTHGTGCTYSAAIAAHLALGATLERAVCRAKEYISQAIARHRRAGRHAVLEWSL
jgi:hydroxymethylpyrimidine/phosphomethylpyrimidine kinase